MGKAQVSDKYIHFALMYTTDYIFPVLPIKHLVNKDGEKICHTNCKLAQNFQYQTHMFYSVHVFTKGSAHVKKKCVKHASSITKSFLWYISWNIIK